MRKITVLLPDDRFDSFEVYCRKNGFKKSTLIARLIREHLEGVNRQEQPDLFLESVVPASDENFGETGTMG